MKVYLLNRVENIVANGEIAHHEKFHLCHKVFKCRLRQRRLKASICGKGLRKKNRNLRFAIIMQQGLDQVGIHWIISKTRPREYNNASFK